MKIQVLFFLAVVFCLARADEYESPESESYSEETRPQTENIESPVEKKASVVKTIVEDLKTETSMVESDQEETYKKNGWCHWGVSAWYRPGHQIKCSCMKCGCQRGRWHCVYHFAYCPYYYCGNVIYNPLKQVCCCGKIYDKKFTFNCCGYFYYNTRTSKCCNYYTVKPKGADCPRYQVGGGGGGKG